MDSKSLMIGDKVLVKVLSQIPDTYVVHTWTAEDYLRDNLQLEPIPLTAEILEQNGWKWDNTRGEYVSSAFSLEWDDDTCKAWLHIGGEYTIINYVHELQRALRLCGLWELADNFKVI